MLVGVSDAGLACFVVFGLPDFGVPGVSNLGVPGLKDLGVAGLLVPGLTEPTGEAESTTSKLFRAGSDS